MTDTVCALCGTNDSAVSLYPSTVAKEHLTPAVFSARRTPDRIHGDILRCNRCGLVYPRQLLAPALLSQLYRESTHTYGDMEKFIRKTYLRYVRISLSFLQDHPRPWRSIDIGCGSGFLLSGLDDLGFEAWGLEPGSDAKAKADERFRERILHGMASEELLKPDTYDLLTCFQTLDHIPDPQAFVSLCLRTLKPGGVALFINHNIASLTARILGERCPMIDIEHTFLHTKGTMRSLFTRAGFEVQSVFSVRNDYPLRYWLHLLPGRGTLKSSLVRMADALGIGGAILPLYAGNLGLIARKPEAS